MLEGYLTIKEYAELEGVTKQAINLRMKNGTLQKDIDYIELSERVKFLIIKNKTAGGHDS